METACVRKYPSWGEKLQHTWEGGPVCLGAFAVGIHGSNYTSSNHSI